MATNYDPIDPKEEQKVNDALQSGEEMNEREPVDMMSILKEPDPRPEDPMAKFHKAQMAAGAFSNPDAINKGYVNRQQEASQLRETKGIKVETNKVLDNPVTGKDSAGSIVGNRTVPGESRQS